jgi:NADPH:quinone reductase-like Zn-dependent oxidoreductase
VRQIWITKAGSPSVLQVREAPDPIPGPSEVRIRVQASGVNFADLMARMGLYPDAPKIPCVVGYEVAGVVDAVGQGGTEFHSGDAVMAMTNFGGYSDVVCVPAAQVLPRPPKMSAQEGAAFLVSYLTTYALLIVMGSLRKGDRVLIQSAAGGLGLAALDICRIYEAETIGLASPSKHGFLRERGLDHVIDSHASDWVERVKEITKGEGVEVVLNSQGGKSLRQSYDLLAPTGRLLTFGASSIAAGTRRSIGALLSFLTSTPRFAPLRLMNDSKGVLGVHIGHFGGQERKVRAWTEQLLAWYNEGKLHPHVDRAFAFSEAAAAHQYLHDRKATGKVVLVP